MLLIEIIISTQKRLGNDFKIKHLGEYHDLHVQNGTLLLAGVFDNSLNICI